jgi:hypothetical protein
MEISRATAAELMEIIVECGNRLVKLLPKLESELSPEDFRKIKREVGRVISVMDESLSAKVAAEYPDLAPEAVPIAHKL